MKQGIVDFVRERPGASFVELTGLFGERAEGCYWYGPGGAIFYWAGMSLVFVEAINDLVCEGRLIMAASSVFTYLADGAALRLPIVRGKYNYKKPHWLPVVFNLGPAEEETK